MWASNQSPLTETTEWKGRHRRKGREREKRTDSSSADKQPLCRDEGKQVEPVPHYGRVTSHCTHFVPLE